MLYSYAKQKSCCIASSNMSHVIQIRQTKVMLYSFVKQKSCYIAIVDLTFSEPRKVLSYELLFVIRNPIWKINFPATYLRMM